LKPMMRTSFASTSTRWASAAVYNGQVSGHGN
jgi:hypothetical protein